MSYYYEDILYKNSLKHEFPTIKVIKRHPTPANSDNAITKELLLEWKFPKNEVEIFAHEWPEGAEVTIEFCKLAAELGIDIYQMANSFLPYEDQDEFDKAVHFSAINYAHVRSSALIKYNDTVAAAKIAHNKEIAPIFYKRWIKYHQK